MLKNSTESFNRIELTEENQLNNEFKNSFV